MEIAKLSGNIFIFHAFDVGDEIDLTAISQQRLLPFINLPLARYFKNYHIPLSVTLPATTKNSKAPAFEQATIHNFGAISLRYKVPFSQVTLEELRGTISSLNELYTETSIQDAGIIFSAIQGTIKQARFFQVRNTYMLIQVDQLPGTPAHLNNIKQEYGHTLASLLRFETETLSERVKDDVLEDAFSYYHKDLIIIDTRAALICDEEYAETLDLFEFANVQHLELQYFDRVLDKQLSIAYEHEKRIPPFRAYLPFIGVIVSDPVGDLGKLKVDISVIIDRLETSIKLADDAYVSQVYQVLSKKMDLENWKESINRKLDIIEDIDGIYQHKLEVIREDILTCSIIVLILLELLMGFFNILK